LAVSTTTIMSDINQKHKILESLDSLDQAQTEKVLNYIKGMTQPLRNEQQIKREALKQIRQALGSSRTLNPSF
jgi:response regulator of citrate/malate metabolism